MLQHQAMLQGTWLPLGVTTAAAQGWALAQAVLPIRQRGVMLARCKRGGRVSTLALPHTARGAASPSPLEHNHE